jgi:CheY-like chemotaxis protein
MDRAMIDANECARAVLVVEDDEDVRDAIRSLIEDEGYSVVEARNGREAFDVLAAGPRPCVILLDLMMPVMDGWQLLEVLHRHDDLAALPVVVLSAARDTGQPFPNVRRYLKKPVPLDALIGAVAEHCAQPSS